MSRVLLSSFRASAAFKTLFPDRCFPDGRVAGAFWKHHPVADQSARTLIASTLAFHRATQGCLVKLTPAGNYQVADRGAHADWCGDPLGRRTFHTRAIHRPQDWLKLDDQLTPLEQEMVGAAQSLSQSLGPKVPLLATVFTPMTQALMLAGPERLLEHLHASPDMVRAGLQRLTCGTERLIAAYHAVGAAGIYLAAQHLSVDTLSREIYRQHGRDSDARVMAACEYFEGNILHIHGASIHFDGLPTDGNWMTHYELGPDNPSPETYRAMSRCPAAIGLPLEVWDDPAHLRSAIGTALSRFGQEGALLTAPCVVPLAVPDERIASWIRNINHVH